MRARLRAAVRALLEDPALADVADAVRLAVLVVAARTPESTGEVELRTGELGRWLGLSRSYVASQVVPALRRAGTEMSAVAQVETVPGEFGQDDCLRFRLRPLWEARAVAGHPLRLRRAEFAVLLRLMEAVMAPGWAHRDGSVTPAGLLGARTGRGAATDRLALLLLVLEAGELGRVRLCGGVADARRGRLATTMARLLGCSPASGERVLERLEERGLVARVRRRTESGLRWRSRLLVPAVAAAHGRPVVADVPVGRMEAEEADGSDPDVAAMPGKALAQGELPQVSGRLEAEDAEVVDPDVAAALHADHSHLGTSVSGVAFSGGFSGVAGGWPGDLPGRACVREDGPLRGEQRKKFPVGETESAGCGLVAGTTARARGGAGQGRQQGVRVPLPPEDLHAVLAPVDLLWARLERPAARRLVEAAARSELKRVEGFAGRTDAPQVLADRLLRRLDDQLRTGGPITEPVGWLLARGLPQRQWCAEPRCDEGALLDSGRDCPRCEDRQIDRRAQRRAVAVAVDEAMPGASESERRAAVAQQLHQDVTAEAWAKARRWEKVQERQAAVAKARAEAAAAAAQSTGVAVVEPVAPVVLPAPRPIAAAPAAESECADVDDQELVLEDLTPEQVLDWRNRAAHDHQVVVDHIDRYGETSARRLFTSRFVDQVERLAGLGHLGLGYTTWGQA